MLRNRLRPDQKLDNVRRTFPCPVDLCCVAELLGVGRTNLAGTGAGHQRCPNTGAGNDHPRIPRGVLHYPVKPLTTDSRMLGNDR